MEDLFSIGEVAKYQNISKQTLIFYDKAGVFRPAWVELTVKSAAFVDRMNGAQ